jgi:hypothetical protein
MKEYLTLLMFDIKIFIIPGNHMTSYKTLSSIIACMILSPTIQAMDKLIEKKALRNNYFIALSINKDEKRLFTTHQNAQQQFDQLVNNSIELKPLFTQYIGSIKNAEQSKAEEITASFIKVLKQNEAIGTHLLKTYRQIPFEKRKKIYQLLANYEQMRTAIEDTLKNNTPKIIES